MASRALGSQINSYIDQSTGPTKNAVAGFVDPALQDWIVMNDAAGAVNALQVASAATGSAVVLTVDGVSYDTNASMTIRARGTGTLTIGGNSNTVTFGGTTLSLGSLSIVNLTATTGSITTLTSTSIAVTNLTASGWISTVGLSVTSSEVITSANSAAFVVGANGNTNPIVRIDASTATVTTGVLITGAASAANVTMAAISAGPNESLLIDGKGNRGVVIGSLSTGAITLGAAAVAVSFGITGITALGGGSPLTFTACQVGGSGPALTTAAGFLMIKVASVTSYMPFWR